MQRSAKRYLIVQRDTQCHDCERFDNLADSYVNIKLSEMWYVHYITRF